MKRIGFTSYTGEVLGFNLGSFIVVVGSYFVAKKCLKIALFVPNLYLLVLTVLYIRMIVTFAN